MATWPLQLTAKIKEVGYLKRFQERTLIKGLRSCTCVSSPRKRGLAFLQKGKWELID